MERGVTVERVQAAVGTLRAAGIATGMFLMWGYEGEQIEDIEATAAHVRNCRPDVFLTTLAYPIKGTPYFEQVKDRIVSAGPWHQTTDRNVVLRGRRSRRFYRYADDLLRASTDVNIDPAKIAQARAGLLDTQAEVDA